MNNSKTSAGQRAVIALIGNRNAGKSTLMNAIIGQNVSITSDIAGTTTDAVSKAYELIPFGPVTFYDTAGLDDVGKLGSLRIEATKKITKRADLILYVIGKDDLNQQTEEKLKNLQTSPTPFIPVFNFADTYEDDTKIKALCKAYNGLLVSALKGFGIEQLKKQMTETLKNIIKEPKILENLITKNDVVMLVTPIDTAAPKGRLILPEVQVIREVLDNNAIVITTQTEELQKALNSLNHTPKIVITDSQAVKEVAKIVPDNIPLTTFSMLLARAKGNFLQMAEGVKAIKNLKDNAHILIAEACSHHITCNDIGRVKIPMMIKKYTAKEITVDFVSGYDFPEDLSPYDLIIHCGGCMINRAEIQYRLKICKEKNIPITNYGMVISLTQGVFERTLAPLL